MKRVKELGKKIIVWIEKHRKSLFSCATVLFALGIIMIVMSQESKTPLNIADEKVYAIEDTLAQNSYVEQEQTTDDVEEPIEESETEIESNDVAQVTSMYDEIAIAHVTNYVNIRKEPNAEAEIVGKIYDGAAATIIGTALEDDAWYQIKSGNVEGFIKAEYFVTGEEASKLADELACKRAVVLTQTLFVREEPTTESKVVGMVPIESAYQVEQEEEEWIRVTIEDGITGWLNKEYVTIDVEFDTAISLEEEQEALEAQALRKEMDAQNAAEQKENEEKQQEVDQTDTQNSENENNSGQDIDNTLADEIVEQQLEEITDYATAGDLRSQIIAYAEQFLGNPYVWGGNSLVTGTDCSGFVMLVYQKFGYSLSRIPSGQYSGVGDTIAFSDCQPGDIVIYGTSSSNLTHSAIYIGNGKVIHEANRRMGVCISDAKTFGTIYGCKRVI